MDDFKGKVAVITGAANGIGRAIAERCAHEGMDIVITDIEEAALYALEKDLRADGARVLSVITDVSKSYDVEALARKTLDVFGAVHLLFNNAGVAVEGVIWENTLEDWQWVLGVNLWGVIHGIRTFTPIMMEQDTPCHMVNTASISGLFSDLGLGVYKVSKHGVVTLSETMYHELKKKKSKLKVSLLCPGPVNTKIADSDRNRSNGFRSQESESPEVEKRMNMLRKDLQAGQPPSHTAAIIFDAIREERFYILTHPERNFAIKNRMEDILQGRNPTNPWKSLTQEMEPESK